MSDLAPLMNWLVSLGPYGYVLAALVPVAVYFLKQRFGPLPPPVTPTPAPTPAVAPSRLDAIAPLLSSLLNALGMTPKGRPATVADLPHETHLQLRDELDAVTAAKSAAHAAALADLNPAPEPTASK
jgi:hypothetical protein